MKYNEEIKNLKVLTMPQVFQVLKCYKCFVFQIHQTKKSNKFDCKICGEKQSIKRHYGIGTGRDCRMHVQKLNILRANKEIRPTTESNSDEENEFDEKAGNTECPTANPVKQSKWSEFIDKEQKTEVEEKPLLLGDREILLEIPQKKKTCMSYVNAKAYDSKEYLFNTINSSKAELKSNMTFSNNYIDINSFESKNIYAQDDILDNSLTSKKQLTCNNINNPVQKNPREKQVDLQTVNKTSKWARYVDTDHSEIIASNDLKIDDMISNNLFSLCKDSDLDQVLDVQY